MGVTAKVIRIDNDIQNCDGLELGKEYAVEEIDMHGFHTDIYLEGYDDPFNSVLFEFYEDGKLLDIYEDARFNPYL